MKFQLLIIVVLLLSACEEPIGVKDVHQIETVEKANETKFKASTDQEGLNEVGCDKSLPREQYIDCSINNLKELNQNE